MSYLELGLITNKKKIKIRSNEDIIEKQLNNIVTKIKNIDIEELDNYKTNCILKKYIIKTIKEINNLDYIENVKNTEQKIVKNILDDIIDTVVEKENNTNNKFDKVILINEKFKDKKSLDNFFIVNKI